MAPLTPTEHLDRAQAAIRQAMAQWDPTDLQKVDGSREMLSAAVQDMRVFESALRVGDLNPTEELRRKLGEVRKDIVQATRLVDACVAFYKGLAEADDASSGYDSDGQVSGGLGRMEPELLA